MPIESYIQQLNWDREPKGLYTPIGYALESGGKRIRPQLALMACEMFGGELSKAVPIALALEIFHNFTLLHDDVMDHADERRGRPTIWRRWNANTAILSGDQMLIEAYKQLEQLPVDLLYRVLPLFSKMATEICEGQQYDMDFEHRDDVKIEDYIGMIRLKTAVLLGTALQMGAFVADAPEADAERLYEFGIKIGLAFQLQDDLLDVYGNEATFGKVIGGDILCNKKTFMFLKAKELATPTQLQLLKEWMGKEDADPKEKIKIITELYDALSIRSFCEMQMNTYYKDALSAMEQIHCSQARKEPLLSLAKKLMNRNN